MATQILPFKTVYVGQLDSGALDNDALMNDLFENELKRRGLYPSRISSEGKWDNGAPFYVTTYNPGDPQLFIELEVGEAIDVARSMSAVAWQNYYEGVYDEEVNDGN